MFSPRECIWLHDKPLSFSSPCQQPTWKTLWGHHKQPEMDFRKAYCIALSTQTTLYLFVFVHLYTCALVYIPPERCDRVGGWHITQASVLSGTSGTQLLKLSTYILHLSDWMGAAEDKFCAPNNSSMRPLAICKCYLGWLNDRNVSVLHKKLLIILTNLWACTLRILSEDTGCYSMMIRLIDIV